MTDGPGGKLFPMEADGWAEVVGYYADGCIKVDVYEIDGHDGAEVVVHQPNQRSAKLVLPYETPSSGHQNLSQLYRVPSSGTQNSPHKLSCRMWNPGCEACVALREAKFRPPELESTVPSSEFRDPELNT
ncbi:hypothetical protein EV424DRAFT_1353931 [Suillus variegatus]|nr:hypothetical protein EV424DRAFT_1353931 [Suillus variegatus]